MTQALIAGASSEIGRAVALELVECGYDVRLWGRNGQELAETERVCEAAGTATASVVDVRAIDQVEAGLADIEAQGPLGVVVYAAGAFDWAPADTADLAAWQNVFDVNLTAAAVLTRLALPPLLRAAPSALVYIGSAAGHQVFAGNAAYVASKHGLVALAGATFLDVRDRDVKVSVISPGLVAAGNGLLSPAGATRPHELLRPSDVAAAVRFVVSFPARGCPTQIHLQPQHTPSHG